VHTLHVVIKVPTAGEAISSDTTLAAFVFAKEGLFSMSMHGMGFTLMAEEAGGGGKTVVSTCCGLAAIWLQVRVDKFAESQGLAS